MLNSIDIIKQYQKSYQAVLSRVDELLESVGHTDWNETFYPDPDNMLTLAMKSSPAEEAMYSKVMDNILDVVIGLPMYDRSWYDKSLNEWLKNETSSAQELCYFAKYYITQFLKYMEWDLEQIEG